MGTGLKQVPAMLSAHRKNSIIAARRVAMRRIKIGALRWKVVPVPMAPPVTKRKIALRTRIRTLTSRGAMVTAVLGRNAMAHARKGNSVVRVTAMTRQIINAAATIARVPTSSAAMAIVVLAVKMSAHALRAIVATRQTTSTALALEPIKGSAMAIIAIKQTTSAGPVPADISPVIVDRRTGEIWPQPMRACFVKWQNSVSSWRDSAMALASRIADRRALASSLASWAS